MADLTRTVAVDVDEATPTETPGFRWPWYLRVVLGAVAVALAGWVVLAGVSALAWLGQSNASFPDALALSTRGFALAHGAPVEIAGQPVGIVPLGLTALQLFLALPVVGAGARQAADPSGGRFHSVALGVDLRRLVLTVGGLHAAVYALTATVLVGAVLGTPHTGHTLLGALLVGLVAGCWGAARAVGLDATATWPRWLRAVPRAMGVALLLVGAAGSVVVALAAWQGRARIAGITAALEPDWSGGIALIVLHLIYLPNFILWACSWLLGAGISLGDGSLVSLVITDVGLLPAIPAFGMVPEPGTAPTAMLWWLLPGVVAGLVAGAAVAWARPRARFDETALVGGLSGVAAGGLLAGLCALSSGALGDDRLAHLGARAGQLLVFAPTLLGLAGLVGGLAVGLLRRPRPETAPEMLDGAAAASVGAEPSQDPPGGHDGAAQDEARQEEDR